MSRRLRRCVAVPLEVVVEEEDDCMMKNELIRISYTEAGWIVLYSSNQATTIMPASFDNCVRGGGRVRTKSLSGNRYLHICFKGGKSHAGHVKTRKTKTKQRRRRGKRRGKRK